MKRAADAAYALVEPEALYTFNSWRKGEGAAAAAKAAAKAAKSGSPAKKAKRAALAAREDAEDADVANDRPAAAVLRELAALAPLADATAIHCVCETSGATSAHQVLECADCCLAVCRRCVVRGQYDVDVHSMAARPLAEPTASQIEL